MNDDEARLLAAIASRGRAIIRGDDDKRTARSLEVRGFLRDVHELTHGTLIVRISEAGRVALSGN